MGIMAFSGTVCEKEEFMEKSGFILFLLLILHFIHQRKSKG